MNSGTCNSNTVNTQLRVSYMVHIFTAHFFPPFLGITSQLIAFFHLFLMCPFKTRIGGFPGGAVVESLPANAGDTGSSPGLGRSHMPRSNWSREPQLLSMRVWSLCSATKGRDSERPAHRDEEWPPARRN